MQFRDPRCRSSSRTGCASSPCGSPTLTDDSSSCTSSSPPDRATLEREWDRFMADESWSRASRRCDRRSVASLFWTSAAALERSTTRPTDSRAEALPSRDLASAVPAVPSGLTNVATPAAHGPGRRVAVAEGGTLSASDAQGLPSGIVTFVLTDIEGSTSLSDASVTPTRDCSRSTTGCCVRVRRVGRLRAGNGGDSFLIAFADAAAARVREGQRSIREHLSGPPAPFGCGSVCTPGRRRLSDAVRVAHHPPDGSDLRRRARGRSSCRTPRSAVGSASFSRFASTISGSTSSDFPEPQRLFQVQAPGMLEEFPPLRTLSVLAHNLPYTSTFRRPRRRTGIAPGPPATQLVTIVGPGGVGKTRLAIETGHDVTGQFADGVWIVDLAPVATPSTYPRRLLHSG